MDFILDVIKDTLSDSIRLLPFLFLTYLGMEYLERLTEDSSNRIIEKAGRFGPFFGGILGAVPQCGFSAAASNLYAGRVITMGTLFAVYLSTSDEMLPLFISHKASIPELLLILVLKAAIGMVYGFLIDLVIRREHKVHHKDRDHLQIEALCEKEHGEDGKEHSVFGAAAIHTGHIFLFILVVTFVLNAVVGFFGQDRLAALMQDGSFLAHFFAGIVGLIPNCAASIVITELYLGNIISLGTMLSGLLVGAGVGLLVLYRVNAKRKENLFITVLLFVLGVITGILIDIAGIHFS